MKGIKEIKDLKNKKVLLRVDFDVPVVNGKIGESFRINKQKPMIDYLLTGRAQVMMVAHISAVDSFEPILSQLEEILGHKIVFLKNLENLPSQLSVVSRKLFLLDNIRQWPSEKENDENFSKQLADGFDIYINNAFAVCHRDHASVSAVAKHLPAYSGFLIEEETGQLQKAIVSSKDGKVMIMGGAKAETKIPVIRNFLDRAEKILLGGVIVNDILAKKGVNIDDSVFDPNFEELLTGLDINDPRLIMPEDFIFSDKKIFDIGPKSIKKYEELIKNAKMIIWNGPVGLFENPDYAKGTNEIALAVSRLKAFKVIGGGDTITAVNKLGILDKFDFVSTGGGAMLSFLAGEKLPGLEALEYYK